MSNASLNWIAHFISGIRNYVCVHLYFFFFFQAEDGIRDLIVTGVQTCALPISVIVVRPQPRDDHRHPRARSPGRSLGRHPRATLAPPNPPRKRPSGPRKLTPRDRKSVV